MTDQELDKMMHKVLLDSIALDGGSEETVSTVFEPSQKHQRQMQSMLKDPLNWVRKKTHPLWKQALQRVAVILLVISVGFGGVMAISPTARAVVIRWFVEWYETHIVYRYSGDTISEELPKYEITGIPEAFVETDRMESTSGVSVFYEDHSGGIICFDYLYMQQGSSTIVTTDDNIVDVTVNGLQGQLFLPTDTKSTTTIVWIDPQSNIQFAIDTTLDESDIMHMAESVVLLNPTKE